MPLTPHCAHPWQVVSPFKDVEGLHFQFHYNLYHKYVYV